MIFYGVWSNYIPWVVARFLATAASGDTETLLVQLLQLVLLSLGSIVFIEFGCNALFLQLFVFLNKKYYMLIMKHLFSLDYHFHTSRSTGKLLAKINRLQGALYGLLYGANFMMFTDLLGLIIPIVFLWFASPIIALVLLLIEIVSIPVFYFLLRYNFSERSVMNMAENEATNLLVDDLTGFDTVKAFAKEEYEMRRIDEMFTKVGKAQYRADFSYRYLFGFAKLVGVLLMVGSIGVAVLLLSQQQISLQVAIVVIGYVVTYPAKLERMTWQVRELVKSVTDFGGIIEILSEKPTITDVARPKELQDIVGNVVLSQVSFSYNGKNVVVNNVSLDIPANQKVAFVGPSGAGKTTLTKLLLRYYDPTSGHIAIDGVPLTEIKQTSFREQVGVVPQDPVMFNNTIAYNVSYSNASATCDDIKHACQVAQLDSFIETLPEKYETVVGERGIKLSGGQRQRLAIARMVLKNPKIFIFDEATSQLDSESEKLIHEALRLASKNKTTILIAHRLSTVVDCDCIYVMDKGAIIESGTHQELIRKQGMYARLWRIQQEGLNVA